MNNRNGLMGKASSAIVAGLLAASMVAPAMALAANQPTAEEQTGTGVTNLTMISQVEGEYGGTTDDPTNNPDSNADSDDWGDNLAFSVPSQINYVVTASGDLLGPNSGADIQNHSSFKTHVSSVDVNNETTFQIVTAGNFGSATGDNVVTFTFGPTNGDLDAANYLTKAAIGPKYDRVTTYDSNITTYYTKSGSTYTAASPQPTSANFSEGAYYTKAENGKETSAVISAWNMDATDGSTATHDDMVQMTTSGDVKNLAADITTQTKFGEIHWYLTPGDAPTA